MDDELHTEAKKNLASDVLTNKEEDSRQKRIKTFDNYLVSVTTYKNFIELYNTKGLKLHNTVYKFKEDMNEGVYHYKFQISQFNDFVYIGCSLQYDNITKTDPYIKILSDKYEVFNGIEKTIITRNVQTIYEVICDMNRYELSIKEGNGELIKISSIKPTRIIYLFAAVGKNSEAELLDYYKLPLLIKRYKIYKEVIKDNNFSFKTYSSELYNFGIDDISDYIVYVVCNQIFKDEDNVKVVTGEEKEEEEEEEDEEEEAEVDEDDNNDKSTYSSTSDSELQEKAEDSSLQNGKEDDKAMEEEKKKCLFTINEEMKENDGVYHFYYEIMSVGKAGIGFGYCQNRISSEVSNIQPKVGEIYEVIYDMIYMQMRILKDGCKINDEQALPTSTNSSVIINPRISISDKNGSVKLIEYYKERQNYGFNDISIYKNTRIDEMEDYRGYNRISTVVLGLPNTIYGMYNYEKYYWMTELSFIKANAPNTDITPIKKIIQSRFRLNDQQKKYINESDVIDLMIFLNCYGDEKINLDKPDSFVKIMNSLYIVKHNKLDENGHDVVPVEQKDYLHFEKAKNDVFQFPANEIYIRDDYYTMFRDILTLIKSFTFVIVTGQPGIGKTSFIYVLLYFLKSLYKMEELPKEINDIINDLKKLGVENTSEFNPENEINRISEEISCLYKQLSCVIDILSSSIEDKLLDDVLINDHLKCIGDTINEINSVKDYYKFNIDKTIDEDQYKEYEGQSVLDLAEEGYNLSLRIKEGMKVIDNLTLIKRLLLLLKTKTDELNVINEYTKYLGKLGLKLDNETLDDTWKRKDKRLKDVYIVKGKRFGATNKKKIYLMKYGYIFKIEIDLKSITDSIIIVDTFNYEFGDNNKIISISSPEIENYKKYSNQDVKYREMYFDSLNDTEIREWFKYCTGFTNSVEDNEFKRICERYGNIPRQIYYHYLYERNYGRDYWDYYKQLIDKVIGEIGYNEIEKEYQYKSNLKNTPLSNIILKYDLQPEWDEDVKHNILKPQKELIYISNSVKNYIECKFYPPKDEEEYKNLEENYRKITDKYMQRMIAKQIVAYKLSHEEINLKKEVENTHFKLNSKKNVSVYYNKKVKKLVHFILDENNFFDLIMDGVFIKVLLEDKELDNGEKFDENNVLYDIKKRMEESIKDYNENDSNSFECCVIIYPKPSVPPKSPTLIFYEEMKFIEPLLPQLGSLDKSLTPIEPTEIENFKSCDPDYYMRKCYKDMLKIICKGNYDFSYQRNYLIFGNKGIGKTVLAKILKYNIIKNSEEKGNQIQAFIDYSDSVTHNYDKNKPYVVIVDGKVVGEDDYADAKMVIMLASPCDEKCKTFESKRFPLLMYIPPLTKEEVEKVKRFDYRNLNLESQIIENQIKSYIDNYEYYGGVIGNYNRDDNINLKNELRNIVDKNLIKEMLRGISKSQYDRIIIYKTYEDDVTRCGNLRFISKTIRDMVFSILFESAEGCDSMMKALEKK